MIVVSCSFSPLTRERSACPASAPACCNPCTGPNGGNLVWRAAHGLPSCARHTCAHGRARECAALESLLQRPAMPEAVVAQLGIQIDAAGSRRGDRDRTAEDVAAELLEIGPASTVPVAGPEAIVPPDDEDIDPAWIG